MTVGYEGGLAMKTEWVLSYWIAKKIPKDLIWGDPWYHQVIAYNNMAWPSAFMIGTKSSGHGMLPFDSSLSFFQAELKW